MPDVVRAFVRHEEAECRGHQLTDLLERSGAERAQECLQFGKRLFDRIEVRAVGREKSQECPGVLNRRAHFGLFVSPEIVEHNDVTGSQRGDEHLLDVGPKGDVVDRAIEHGRRGQLGRAKPRDHRVGLPMAAGRVIRDARAARTASVAAQQVGGNAGFVDEDVLGRIMDR